MQEKSIAGIRTRRSGGVVRLGRWLLERPRLLKRAVLVCIDFFILSIAIWVALCLRHKSLYFPTDPVETAVLLAGPVITLGVFAWFGFYKMVTRFMGARSTTSILLYIALSVLLWTLLVFMTSPNNVPRSAIAALGIVGGLGIWDASLNKYSKCS